MNPSNKLLIFLACVILGPLFLMFNFGLFIMPIYDRLHPWPPAETLLKAHPGQTLHEQSRNSEDDSSYTISSEKPTTKEQSHFEERTYILYPSYFKDHIEYTVSDGPKGIEISTKPYTDDPDYWQGFILLLVFVAIDGALLFLLCKFLISKVRRRRSWLSR
jgi:hypothetical protein